jgi:hypothetical protein
MQYTKPLSVIAVLVTAILLFYSNFIRADISFAQKPSQALELDGFMPRHPPSTIKT